jgi:hypothetical protein
LSPQTFSASTARSIAASAEPTGGRQPFAQANDARKGVDDAKLARPAGHRDQEAAIVGAEVERGESRRMMRTRRNMAHKLRHWRPACLSQHNCVTARFRTKRPKHDRTRIATLAGENLTVFLALTTFLLRRPRRGQIAIWTASEASLRRAIPRRRCAGVTVVHSGTLLAPREPFGRSRRAICSVADKVTAV